MEDQALMDWLLDAGGPVIRYRTSVELSGSPILADPGRLEAVVQSPKTQWLLAQMDRFGPLTRMDIHVLNELHGMKPTCLENVIPRLLERGVRAGFAVFDEKMERLRQYVDNSLVHQALDDPDHPTVEGGRAVFIATVLASYFLRAGYEYDESMQFVLHRVEMLSCLARERNYAIHLRQAELAGLPKPWAGKPVLRPEMDPMSGSKPLPLIHDIHAFAHLPTGKLKDTTRQQLSDIIRYVTDERYRAFPPGYGYIWTKANRQVCYACGWNLDLPDPESLNPYHQRIIVQRLELMTHFPESRQSTWFQKGMQKLETFRTARGTYCFPPAYLLEKNAGYNVGGEYMGLEDNRRKALTLELESTFRMLLLKKLASDYLA
jgi:hypothetical protein